MRKNNRIFGLVVPFVLGFLLVTFFSTCKSEKKMEEGIVQKIISRDTLIPVLGEGEGSVHGLLDVEQGSEEVKISYYYYILDMDYFDDEIERDLAPKIQEMYRTIPELNRVAFTIYIPTMDETPYKPYVSFALTRDLVEKTDWMNLLELDFFKVVMDVKYYE